MRPQCDLIFLLQNQNPGMRTSYASPPDLKVTHLTLPQSSILPVTYICLSLMRLHHQSARARMHPTPTGLILPN
jgi:hypothetical protein